MSQFAFLQAEFADIFAHAARAETLAHADPCGAAFYCRLAPEIAVGWLYRHDRTCSARTDQPRLGRPSPIYSGSTIIRLTRFSALALTHRIRQNSFTKSRTARKAIGSVSLLLPKA
jgi:hypothetical protein